MLGDTLREAREKQGLTYKDIEKGTSIRALYIEYIEKGEYDELPGDVYTKGFIRSYANFLKLDANALVQAFTAERHEGTATAAPAAPGEPPRRHPTGRGWCQGGCPGRRGRRSHGRPAWSAAD